MFYGLILYFICYFLFQVSMTEKIPYINISENIQKYKNIPLIIYKTYPYRYINRIFYKYCHEKWLLLNPDCTISWYNDNQCEKFMKEFDSKVYTCYKKLKPGSFKADLWRLCILYKYGGIYCDSYTTPFKSIKYIIDNSEYKKCGSSIFISVLDAFDNGIHNGFIIATQGHPFLLQGIKDIVYNVENNYYTDHMLGVTGPRCLEKSIQNVLQSKIKNKKGLNGINSKYPFYLLEFSFGPYQYIKQNNVKVLSKQYSFLHWLYNKFYQKKTTYEYMWKNGDIFNKE
jgi:mannosyltransferase OCH1-like enzyme